MRTIFSATRKLVLSFGTLGLLISSVSAQSVSDQRTRSFGLNLPTPTTPHGFDEVRASDGTTCRSSLSNGGPYVDIGGIGSPGLGARDAEGSVYGRVIIPLGERPGRLDCRSLYQVEIDRLRHELSLARTNGDPSAGLNGKNGDPWADEGWNNK